MTDKIVEVDKGQKETPDKQKTLKPGQVADYLKEHPDFLLGVTTCCWI